MNQILNNGLLDWICRLAIAAAMIAAALGSGNPATADPLPDWINASSNLICLVIALILLVPRLQEWGAGAAAVMMVLSMATNYVIDGPGYFWQVLPFNLVTLAFAAVLLWRGR